jgi:hypothetical protein
MNEETQSQRFHIWQQNLGKSLIAQHDLLAKANPRNWDIIALQEPYINHLGLIRANSHWSVIYPSNNNHDNKNRIRPVMLLNTDIKPEQIQQIKIMSSDISAIKITTSSRSMVVVNIYNDNLSSDTIDNLAREWETHEGSWLGPYPAELFVLGDFNRHHTTWEGITNAHLTSTDRCLNSLLGLIVNMRLEMTLPRGMPTLEACNTGNWTQPDNAWRCADAPSTVISCDVEPILRPS